jgi:hypothetical protein
MFRRRDASLRCEQACHIKSDLQKYRQHTYIQYVCCSFKAILNGKWEKQLRFPSIVYLQNSVKFQYICIID